jgi:hypothetical protein
MKTNRQISLTGKSIFQAIGSLFLVLVFISCAGIRKQGSVHEMALKPGMDRIDSKNMAICLISLKTENQYKPEHSPKVLAVRVVSENSGKQYNFCPVKGGVGGAIGSGLKDAFSFNKKSGPEEYLLSLKIPSGSYRLVSIAGNSISPLIHCNFDFPFEVPFQVQGNGVIYLGRIEMVNREKRSDDDIASGSRFPLLDQAICGFGGGTFDVIISDNFEPDMVRYKKEFPALADLDIQKDILRPWNKSEALKSSR